jgi:hypothetical protein
MLGFWGFGICPKIGDLTPICTDDTDQEQAKTKYRGLFTLLRRAALAQDPVEMRWILRVLR